MRTMRMKSLFHFSLLVIAASWKMNVIFAGTSDHVYGIGEHVELWVNKVRCVPH
jgi:hypothetical protein